MADGAGSLTLSEAELEQGFAAFVTAARRLEARYAALQARAAAIDLQLQQSNQQLQRALAERDAIFGALPLGVLAVGSDGVPSFCNQEGERLCALARGRGCELASAPDGDCALPGLLVRVRRVGLPDGQLVLVEDRTRLAALEGEVQRLDRLAGLSELALGVAHEIKNPLNGVLGFAELLQRQTDPVACRRYAARVAAGIRQVDDIVRALLGFAGPAAGRGATASVTVLVAEAAAAAGLPRQRVELTGDGGLPGDADALIRVLANLFRNSREAAGDRVAVRVHAEARDGWLLLTVADDGPGVAAELGRSLFAPFVSSKERGTGLGLALSARVLAFLGGGLELLNPGEPGARFLVRVPLAARPAEALP